MIYKTISYIPNIFSRETLFRSGSPREPFKCYKHEGRVENHPEKTRVIDDGLVIKKTYWTFSNHINWKK